MSSALPYATFLLAAYYLERLGACTSTGRLLQLAVATPSVLRLKDSTTDGTRLERTKDDLLCSVQSPA